MMFNPARLPQPRGLEGPQCACGLEAAVVSDGDRPIRGKRLGHQDDGARAIPQDFSQDLRPFRILSREPEVESSGQHDQVAGLRLGRDQVVRWADQFLLGVGHSGRGASRGELVQELTDLLMHVGQSGLIPHVIDGVLARGAAHGPGRLDREDTRLINDPQADKHGTGPLGESNAQLREDLAVLGPIEPDQDAAEHEKISLTP